MGRGNPRNQKIELESPILNEFLATMEEGSSSREEHRNRLISLERFVKKEYKTLINNNFVLNRLVGERKKATGKKIYVYSFFSDYCNYLKKNKPNISRKRVELLLHSARQAINLATDGIIRNDVYRLKVKNLPAKSKDMKTRIDHEDIVELILAIGNNLRLRTVVMLLAGSGLRIMEAIRTQYKFIQWDAKPPHINLPAKVSKTGVERNVMLTGEMVKALKTWLDYKYRERRIVRKNGDIDDYEKPEDIGDSYIFKIREDKEMENYRFIYKMFQAPFREIVKKTNLGKKFNNGRNSVTLHSLRWYTQSTVERVTKRDVVGYYWIGKEQKNYQFEPNNEEELIELYNMIEPHLTFLDSKIIDQNQQKQIDQLTEQMNQQRKELKKEFLIYKFEQAEDSYQEFIASQFERTGKNIASVTPDIPKAFVENALEAERKEDPKLTLEEMCFIKVKDIVDKLHSLNAEDEKILNKYIEEEYGDYNFVCCFFGLPAYIANMSGLTPDEIRRKINLWNPTLRE